MAYNNGFPLGYQPVQPIYQPTYQPMQNAPQMAQNGIIWVSGEAGAKAYMIAPNSTVQLWDSEEQVIYLKSADASGMPSMKILDYTVRETNQPTAKKAISNDVYVTKQELKDYQDALEKRLKALTGGSDE